MTSKDEERIKIASSELAGHLIRPVINIIANYSWLTEEEKIYIVFTKLHKKGDILQFVVEENQYYLHSIEIQSFRTRCCITSKTRYKGSGAAKPQDHYRITMRIKFLLPSKRLLYLHDHFGTSDIEACSPAYIAKMAELMADV